MNRTGSSQRATKLLLPVCTLLFTLAGILLAWFLNRPSPDSETHATTSPATVGANGSRPNVSKLRGQIEAALANPHTPDVMLRTLGASAFELGKIGLAEECYRRAVERGSQTGANQLALGKLLYATGRTYDAGTTWNNLLRDGGIDLLALPLLGNSQLTFQSESEAIRRGLDESPDSITRLANVHRSLQDRDVETAGKLLSPFLASDDWPGFFKVQQAKYLFLTGQNEILGDWLSDDESRPTRLTPEYLCIVGRYYREKGDLSLAFVHFRHAFELAPHDYDANSQLAELLHAGGKTEAADFFRQRSDGIKQYAAICRRIHNADALPARSVFESAIRVCRQLNLFRDAVAWSLMSQAIHPNDEEMRAVESQCASQISPDDDRTSHMNRLVTWLDGTEDLFAGQPAELRGAALSGGGERLLFFEDESISHGINFQYDSGRRVDAPTRFFEFLGGGAGPSTLIATVILMFFSHKAEARRRWGTWPGNPRGRLSNRQISYFEIAEPRHSRM
jgi:tetratricopeptide (TPR) repeat protein